MLDTNKIKTTNSKMRYITDRLFAKLWCVARIEVVLNSEKVEGETASLME